MAAKRKTARKNILKFTRVDPLQGTRYLQAEAETDEEAPRRAVVCFGSEYVPMDVRTVKLAIAEAETLRPKPELLIFSAFQFDAEAAQMIDQTVIPDMILLKVQMNMDLQTDDLKKKRASDQSFWLVGQPDVELTRDKETGLCTVRVRGFDYYDAVTGRVQSGGASQIAMWELDEDYNGDFMEPSQVFFPMSGKNGGWNNLAKTLRAVIDPEKMEKYSGTESLPFRARPGAQIAVKIIDAKGLESMVVLYAPH